MHLGLKLGCPSCRVTLPPVDLRAVCLVRAMIAVAAGACDCCKQVVCPSALQRWNSYANLRNVLGLSEHAVPQPDKTFEASFWCSKLAQSLRCRSPSRRRLLSKGSGGAAGRPERQQLPPCRPRRSECSDAPEEELLPSRERRAGLNARKCTFQPIRLVTYPLAVLAPAGRPPPRRSSEERQRRRRRQRPR